MPKGTGHRLEDFSVGDEVTVKYMLDANNEDSGVPAHFGDFNPIEAIGTITTIGRGSYPIRVEFEDLEYLAETGIIRFDVFKANELASINREPRWEV